MERIVMLFIMCLAIHCSQAQNYHGVIVGKDDGHAVYDATVQFFEKDVFIGGTKSGEDGGFEVSLDKKADKVVVTSLGYGRFVKSDTLSLPNELGSIALSPKSVQLGDVVVRGSLRRQESDKDIYLITDSLRKGIVNSAQLLERIPGVLRDWDNDNLIIDGVKDIAILVNNVEKGARYAMKINPRRIKQVEITHNPLGKYSDRKVLVNITLYDDYKGWDLTPYSYLQYGKANMNTERIGVSYTHSINKFSFNISSDLSNDATRDSRDMSSTYHGDIVQTSRPMDMDVANLRDDELTYGLSAGAEYRLAKDHSLSMQMQGKFNQGNSRESYLFSVSSPTENYVKEQASKTKDYSDDYTVGLFYRGRLWRGTSLNSDLTYNYYTVKKKRRFSEGKDESVSPTLGKKDYVRYNVNLRTPITRHLDWYTDYSFTWRKYNDRDRETGEATYFSRNTRHNLLNMLTWHPVQEVSLSGGVQWIGSEDDNNEGVTSDYSLNPLFRVYAKPWDNVTVRSNFELSTSAPNLEKLSSTEYQVDSWTWQRGNPLLKNSTFINWESSVSIDKVVTLMCQYFKNKNSHAYQRYYQDGNGRIIRSYFNTDWSRLSLTMSGNYNLFGDFYLGGDVYYGNDGLVDVDGRKKRTDAYMGDLLAQYTVSPLKLRVQLMYQYIEEHQQTIQGNGLSKIDLAKLTIARSFFNDNLEASLTAESPVGLFRREIYVVTDTPFYYSRMNSTLNKVTGPFVSLNLRVYLSGGKQTRMSENRFVVDSEK